LEVIIAVFVLSYGLALLPRLGSRPHQAASTSSDYQVPLRSTTIGVVEVRCRDLVVRRRWGSLVWPTPESRKRPKKMPGTKAKDSSLCPEGTIRYRIYRGLWEARSEFETNFLADRCRL